jgi:signal peptidase II
MKNKYLWVGSIAGVVLLLDQVTKFLVIRRIGMFEVITVIPGFFNFTYVRNRGAAFGMLAGVPGAWRSAFFIIVTVIAVAAIVLLIRKTSERLLVAAFSLIAGGALGNLIDRVRWGEVVDFIDWYVRSYHWPTFNIADSAISVGVGLLVIDMLFRKPEKTEKPL